MNEHETKGLLEFGDFRLDAERRRLWKNGEQIPLTPKEFDVLTALIRKAGSVVPKDELLDEVWKDVYVEEATLTRNISFLRKKLGPDEIIETLPKRGYRFLPAVRGARPSLIVEERRLTKITVEDTITVSDAAAAETSSARPALPGRTRRFRYGLVAIPVLLAAPIGLIIYFGFLRNSPPAAVTAARVVPFSGLPGRENMPAFSPDGKQIAFTWNGGNDVGNFDIYLRMIGAGDPVRLTTNGADDLFPTFSPDGKRIAFLRSHATSSEVYLISALGGAERKIADLRSVRSRVAFSPDGKTLAAADAKPGSDATAIFLFDIESGERKRISTPPAQVGDDMPVFSPDGKTVGFLRSFGAVWQEVFTVGAMGGEARQITFDKARIRGAAFAPDGRIVFASQRVNNQWNLWRASPGGEPQMIATGENNLSNPAVSPDGASIAFTVESNDTNIWSFRLDAKRSAANPPRVLISSSRPDHSPTVSPDGASAAFASDRSGTYQIWSSGIDGGGQRQLTEMAGAAGSPRFSPDGRSIVFDAIVEGSGDIFVIAANGGAPRNLTASPARDSLPSWSVDGRFVFFASNRGGSWQLWRVPAEGGEPVQVTRSGAFESFASPDGAHVFYTKERGASGIWKVPVDGGEESPVPELADAGYWRYWAVTREGVYYVARSTNAPYRLRFYDLSTGKTSDVAAADKAPVWIFGGLAVTPDAQAILYAHSDQNFSTIMLAGLEK